MDDPSKTAAARLPRRRFLGLGAGLALSSVLRAARAQAYPSRPITMIVPYPAGGPTDSVGRIVAEHMRAEIGQPIVIENVSGAAGSIGLGRVARAAADGYTIEVGNWSAHVVNGAIYNLPYDLTSDFEPIALLSRAPLVVLSKMAVPANNLKDLIAWLKANPGKATLGTAGVGSPPHMAALLFFKMTGTQAQLVPYHGAAEAVQALVAGQIDMVITDPTSSVPQVRAGTIKGYAVSSRERMPGMAEIPTADEAGLPGYYIATWNAMFAPRGTPKAIVSQLNAAAMNALADPAVRDRMVARGQEIPPPEKQTPGALAALIKTDVETWWPIIKAANIKVEN
jgi:tripartite-type tricarboxylate transporter receptor subunit TctC